MGNSETVKKVLIVDDYRVIRELLAKYLDRPGFKTCMASDGREALEVFQREKPDLLISDLHMPNMDGLELIRQVRAISNIPILIMTGGSGYMSGDMTPAMEAGADASLKKPFDLDDLLAEIKVVLARTEPRGRYGEIGKICRSFDQQQRPYLFGSDQPAGK
jgi:DNA-binding response OmpR family regulator